MLRKLPGFDFGFFAANPEFSFVLFVALVIFGVIGFFWIRLHVAEFKERVRQGFAVLRDRRRYLREVALWQVGDWMLRFVAIWFFLDAFGDRAVGPQRPARPGDPEPGDARAGQPGGIGTEQAFIVYVFHGTVGGSKLLAFSVGMKLTLIVTNVIVGFTALFLTLGTSTGARSTGKSRPRADT